MISSKTTLFDQKFTSMNVKGLVHSFRRAEKNQWLSWNMYGYSSPPSLWHRPLKLHTHIHFSHLIWNEFIWQMLKDVLNEDNKKCYLWVQHWIYLHVFPPLWFPKTLNFKKRAPKQNSRDNVHELYSDIYLCYTIIL